MTIFSKKEYALFAISVFAALFIFIPVYTRSGEKALHWGGLDTQQYHILAENVLNGRGFSMKIEPPFTPNATRTPGYPLLLATSKYLTGNSIPIILLQILAFGGIIVLTYKIGQMLLGDERRAWWAALLLILELQMLYFALLVMSDIFFIFLFLLSVWFLLYLFLIPHPKYYYAAALSLGLATLIRPGGILFILLYAVYSFFIFRKTFSGGKTVAVLGIGIILFILPILPWAIRNERQFGTFRLTSADTYNLYYYLPKRIVALQNGTTLLSERIRFTEQLQQEAGCTDFEAHDTFRCSAWMEGEAWRIIRAHPFLMLESLALAVPDHLTAADWVDPFVRWKILKPAVPEGHQSLLRVGINRDWSELLRQMRIRTQCGVNCVASSLLLLFGRITWALITILAAIGGITLWRRKEIRPLVLLSFAIIFYTIGVNSFFLTYFDVAERFRLQIFPFLFIFAVAGWPLLCKFMSSCYRIRRMIV